MLASIQFGDEFLLEADKVGDEIAEGLLAAELERLRLPRGFGLTGAQRLDHSRPDRFAVTHANRSPRADMRL